MGGREGGREGRNGTDMIQDNTFVLASDVKIKLKYELPFLYNHERPRVH